jgi:hypothetical protein
MVFDPGPLRLREMHVAVPEAGEDRETAHVHASRVRGYTHPIVLADVSDARTIYHDHRVTNRCLIGSGIYGGANEREMAAAFRISRRAARGRAPEYRRCKQSGGQ